MTTSGKRVEMYVHAYLRRTAPDGSIWHTIGFIPLKFAAVGKRLDIKVEGKLRTGYEVMSFGKELFPGHLLVQQSQDYKRMRKASDI